MSAMDCVKCGGPFPCFRCPAPDRKPGGVLYPDTLPNPEPCTYIGAGGLIEVKVRPSARLEQLRLARRFLDLLIDLEAKP